MVSDANKLSIAFVIGIAAYTSVVFGSELLRHPVMSVTDSINGLLALTVAIFAIVQGMSAFIQLEMQKNKNLVEHAKNEIEKAYAPLFVLLNDKTKWEFNGIRLDEKQKWSLDLVLATYPLTTEIKEYWKNNVQAAGLVLHSEEIKKGIKEPAFHIPIAFRDMINAEYEKRVKEYNQLLLGQKSKK